MRNQRACDRKTTLLATTEGQGLMTGEILNSKLSQERITPLFFGATITWHHLQDRYDIFLDRQFTENRFLLREIPHTHPSPPMHCEARHIALSKVNSTPIWPHKPYDFTPLDMDINPVHYRPPAIDLY